MAYLWFLWQHAFALVCNAHMVCVAGWGSVLLCHAHHARVMEVFSKRLCHANAPALGLGALQIVEQGPGCMPLQCIKHLLCMFTLLGHAHKCFNGKA